MIQINMPMPKSCDECRFAEEAMYCAAVDFKDYNNETGVGYIFNPDDPFDISLNKTTINRRMSWCPLQEVPEKKDFEFEIPEKCGDCKSMTPYGEKYYCHMDAISPENSQQDISTIFVNPESRPVWCPTVKMNETYKSMPPEKKEQFNKFATGLSALFGSVQVKKEED